MLRQNPAEKAGRLDKKNTNGIVQDSGISFTKAQQKNAVLQEAINSISVPFQ